MPELPPKERLIRQPTGGLGGQASAESAVLASIKLERFQALEQQIRNNPVTAEPYLELAKIYLQERRWVDARRILNLAFEKFDDVEEVAFLREEANLGRSMQLFDEARTAHAAEPTRLTQDQLDRVNVELNVLRESICRSRLKRHPHQVKLNLPLAGALEALGKHEAAIECLQVVVQIPELRATAALQLGKTLERVGRIPEALSAYRRAALFRIPPPAPELRREALLAAADLAEKSMMIDSAKRYMTVLLADDPGNDNHRSRLERLSDTAL